MKRNRFFFILIITVILAVPGSCKKKEVAVKIDDTVITIDDFYSYYYTQNKILLNLSKEDIDKLAADPMADNHPTLSKTKFMDFIISRKLIYTKAMDDDALNKKELKTVVDLFKMQGVSTYYLLEKFKEEIKISDEEIDKFYMENKQRFQGVPMNEQVVMSIKQQIFMNKFEQKSNEYVMDLVAETGIKREGLKKHLAGKQDTPAKKLDSDEIAVKYGDEKIKLGEFYNYYYTQNKILFNKDKAEEIEELAADPGSANHPTLNKSKFVDSLISRKLIYKKALDDNKVNKKELNVVIDLFNLQGVSTYYMTEKLKKEIVISDEDVDKFYNENRQLFKGAPINDQILSRIKQQLFLRQFEQKSNEYVMDLIAEARVNREGFKNHIKKLKAEKEKGDSKKAENKNKEPEKK